MLFVNSKDSKANSMALIWYKSKDGWGWVMVRTQGSSWDQRKSSPVGSGSTVFSVEELAIHGM